MDTLPDYLNVGLDVVFVGINPGIYSVGKGRYFANPRNRFWPALSLSGLLPTSLPLNPFCDQQMNQYGVGFTDVVKRPTHRASDLKTSDYQYWVPILHDKLLRYQPLIICFNGLTGYRNYLRYADQIIDSPSLGLQARSIGESHVFVIPSSSPANAATTMEMLVEWFQKLAKYCIRLKETGL